MGMSLAKQQSVQEFGMSSSDKMSGLFPVHGREFSHLIANELYRTVSKYFRNSTECFTASEMPTPNYINQNHNSVVKYFLETFLKAISFETGRVMFEQSTIIMKETQPDLTLLALKTLAIPVESISDLRTLKTFRISILDRQWNAFVALHLIVIISLIVCSIVNFEHKYSNFFLVSLPIISFLSSPAS